MTVTWITIVITQDYQCFHHLLSLLSLHMNVTIVITCDHHYHHHTAVIIVIPLPLPSPPPSPPPPFRSASWSSVRLSVNSPLLSTPATRGYRLVREDRGTGWGDPPPVSRWRGWRVEGTRLVCDRDVSAGD